MYDVESGHRKFCALDRAMGFGSTELHPVIYKNKQKYRGPSLSTFIFDAFQKRHSTQRAK